MPSHTVKERKKKLTDKEVKKFNIRQGFQEAMESSARILKTKKAKKEAGKSRKNTAKMLKAAEQESPKSPLDKFLSSRKSKKKMFTRKRK